MNIKCLVYLFILTYNGLVVFPCKAQSTPLKPLKIGDTVPNLMINKIINYSASKARLHSFKGKLLILDFWATTCAGCLASFPKLEQLQATYRNKLAVMLVTYYKDEKYNHQFFDRRKKDGKPITLPSVVEDTVLRKLFPHNGYPHVVWIDQHSVVKAITYSEAVIPRHIDEVFAGGDGVSFRMKPHIIKYPSDLHKRPFLLRCPPGSKLTESRVCRSFFSNYVDTLNRIQYLDNNSDFTRIYFANSTVPEMIRQASMCILAGVDSLSSTYAHYKGFEKKENSTFTYKDFSDFKKLDYDALEELFTKYCFCYEITLPPSFSLAQAGKFMLSDLEKYLDITVAFETRQRDIIYLEQLFSNVTDSVYSPVGGGNGITLNQLVTYLNDDIMLPLFIINKNYNGDHVVLDIDLEQHYNLKELKNIFRKLHIVMLRKKEYIKTAVIQ